MWIPVPVPWGHPIGKRHKDVLHTLDSVLSLTRHALLQDGNHAFIRLNFNFGPGYEPCAKFPGAICLKELSFRSSDPRHAQRVRLLSVIDHSCPPVALPLHGYPWSPALLCHS